MVGGMGTIAVAGGGGLNLAPGALVRLRDVDNLRVLATQKGLILEAGNNGRRAVKLTWQSKDSAKAAKASAKAAAKASAKAAAKVGATSAQAKSMSASAKSMAASAEALGKVAKSISAPAKSVALGAGATKAAGAAAGSVLGGTGLGLGLGMGLGALGPLIVIGALAASTSGIYLLLRSKRTDAEMPEH